MYSKTLGWVEVGDLSLDRGRRAAAVGRESGSTQVAVGSVGVIPQHSVTLTHRGERDLPVWCLPSRVLVLGEWRSISSCVVHRPQ